MKSFLLILSLVFLVSCGKGGSSGAVSPSVPVAPIDDQDTIHTYQLIITGAVGTHFESVATRDFGGADHVSSNWFNTLDNSQLSTITIFGRSAHWQIYKTNGGDLNLKILKDGVEVVNENLTQNNQTVILTDNI